MMTQNSRPFLLIIFSQIVFILLIIAYNQQGVIKQFFAYLYQRPFATATSSSIFVYSAYYLPQNELRLTAIVDCYNGAAVRVVLPLITGETATVSLHQQLMHFCHLAVKNCSWSGHYYSMAIPKNVDKSKSIILKRDNSILSVSLNVTIIQPHSSKKRYFLSACIKWITMNVDWQGILQYILVWQALGVEHFYMYVQEVSPEVDRILKIFEQEKLVTRIPRSSLPPILGDYIDVNLQIDFAADTLTLNDCQLRSRDNSEWVTMADSDELIVAIDNRTNAYVPNLLKFLSHHYPNAGAFLFRSSKSQFIRLPSTTIALKNITFDYLKNVQTIRQASKFKDMSRAIVRPADIFRIGLHEIFQFEKWKPNAEQIIVSPDIALVLHLRRPITPTAPLDNVNSMFTNVLAPYADRANDRWRTILSLHNLSHIRWDYYALNVLQNLDGCLSGAIDRDTCPSFGRRCSDMFKLNRRIPWIYAPNTWTVI